MYSKELKIEAVRLFLEEGMTRKDIAKQLGVVGGRDTIKKWVQAYRRNHEADKFFYVNSNNEKVDATCVNSQLIQTQQRLKSLEMQVDLLKNFLLETERRSIKL